MATYSSFSAGSLPSRIATTLLVVRCSSAIATERRTTVAGDRTNGSAGSRRSAALKGLLRRHLLAGEDGAHAAGGERGRGQHRSCLTECVDGERRAGATRVARHGPSLERVEVGQEQHRHGAAALCGVLGHLPVFAARALQIGLRDAGGQADVGHDDLARDVDVLVRVDAARPDDRAVADVDDSALGGARSLCRAGSRRRRPGFVRRPRDSSSPGPICGG